MVRNCPSKRRRVVESSRTRPGKRRGFFEEGKSEHPMKGGIRNDIIKWNYSLEDN